MNHELGITFRSESETPALISEVARCYGLGIDMLGVYDDMGDMSPIVPLVAAANSLDRKADTRLGPVGFAVPKHRSMVDVVGHMTTLYNLRPDRVFLGLVPGAWMESVSLRSASVQQVREAAESAQYLFERGEVGYEGRYYNVRPGFTLNYPTPRRVPLLIGAYGPRLVALAGEIADEMKVGGSANPELVPIMRDRLSMGTSHVGRNPLDIRLAFGAVSVIDQDRVRALEAARKKAIGYIGVVGGKDPTLARDFPDEIDAIIKAMHKGDYEQALKYLPDKLLRRLVFAGDANDIIAQAEALFDAGVDRIEFGTPHGVREELAGIALLITKVFPHFRRR